MTFLINILKTIINNNLNKSTKSDESNKIEPIIIDASLRKFIDTWYRNTGVILTPKDAERQIIIKRRQTMRRLSNDFYDRQRKLNNEKKRKIMRELCNEIHTRIRNLDVEKVETESSDIELNKKDNNNNDDSSINSDTEWESESIDINSNIFDIE